MANKDTVEFRLFDTDLTSVLGILAAGSMDLYLQLNEPGSGAVKIPLKSRAAGLVTSTMFASGKYRGGVRGGFFIENIGRDEAPSGEAGAQWMSISGRGALALLDDAIVWDDGTAATTRELTGTRAGMLIDLIVEAQARGALLNLNYDFTDTLDSNGNAWTDDETIKWNVGTSLLDVARQISSKIAIDFDIVPDGAGGFTLSAYKNGKGTDKSETVYFRVGVNCEEVGSLEAGGEIRNALRVGYKFGYTAVSNSASVTTYRRREKLLDARAAQTTEAALTYGAAELSNSKNPKKSITVKIYDGKGPRAFVDYGLGDTITLDVKGVETEYRVRGMQLSWDGKKYADVIVDLNSIILENEIRMAQDIGWLLNQWETARDVNLLAVSYWAALADDNDTITSITCSCLVGTKIYFGGYFTKLGGKYVGATQVASYDTATGIWEPLPAGDITYVLAIASSGTDLYVGGFGGVQKYDTVAGTWSDLVGGLGLSSYPWIPLVRAMSILGDKLYVGGQFDAAGGASDVHNLACYDITAETWDDMGSGITDGIPNVLLAVGSKVYIGGSIAEVGGSLAVSNVASWNTGTSTYDDMDGGLDGAVWSFAEYGTNLLAGGGFTDAIAEWDGADWAVFGGGIAEVTAIVRGIAVYLTDVYVVGEDFGAVGNGIARNSAGLWSQLGVGLNGTVNTIVMIDDDVYVAGTFTEAGGKPALKAAAYFSNFESLMGYLENSGNVFNMGAAIHNAPAAAISDLDEIPFWEDVANALRKITWANIKATLKTYFDTLYMALTGVANRVLVTDADGAVTTYEGFYWDPTLGIIYLGGSGGMASELTGNSVLNLLAKADDTQVLQTMWSWGDSLTTNPAIVGYRSRGTKASPTALMSGDRLWNIAALGHDGVGWVGSVARALIKATEDWDATAHGTAWYFEGTPRTTTTREQFAELDELGFNIPAGRNYMVNGVPVGGGGGGVESVTGDGVDNTDPLNPVLTFPTPAEIGAATAAQGALADTALQAVTTDASLSGDGTVGNPLSMTTFETVVSSASIVTLTAASARVQEATGASSQIYRMPDVTTLILGQEYIFIANCPGGISVRSSGNNAIAGASEGQSIMLRCISLTGTTESSWSVAYFLLPAQVAHSILANTNSVTTRPEPMPVAEDRLVGRLAGGQIDDLSVPQIKTLLGISTATTLDAVSSAPAYVDGKALLFFMDDGDFKLRMKIGANQKETILATLKTTLDIATYTGARLVSNTATTNYNLATLSANTGYIGERNDATQVNRVLLKYGELSDGTIPATSTIFSAKLFIYINADLSASATDLEVYRQKRAWVNSQATQTIYSTGNAWQSLGGFGADDCEQTAIGSISLTAAEAAGWKEIDLDVDAITEIVDGTWADNGFLLKHSVELNDAYRYGLSVANDSNLPYIEVYYL